MANKNEIFWTNLLADGPRLLVGQPADQIRLENIDKISILSGGRKAKYIETLITRSVASPIEVSKRETTWKENSDSVARPRMKGLSAVLKAGIIERDNLQKESAEVRVANDVQLVRDDGVELFRLGELALAEQLFETLATQRKFEVFSTTAMIGGSATGIYSTDEHRFVISSLDSEEISEYIDIVDQKLLLRSPGGLLWPHPILRNHIVEVDGLQRDNEDFEEQLMRLYRSLLGIPESMTALFSEMNNQLSCSEIDPEADVFRFVRGRLPLEQNQELNGVWRELVPLKSGRSMILSTATDKDYSDMCAIARQNFLEAPNYSYLREPENKEELDKYIKANTPENLADTCSQKDPLCNLVAKIGSEILGFRIVRQNGNIANGRRLHVKLGYAGDGIGRVLVDRSEELAKQAHCDVIEIHATGDSASWFQKIMGYNPKGEVSNNRGVFSDKPTHYILLAKRL